MQYGRISIAIVTLNLINFKKHLFHHHAHSLRTDLRRERHKKICSRKGLEQDWYRSMKEKQTFLLNELQRVKEQGMLLHQQCEKYQR